MRWLVHLLGPEGIREGYEVETWNDVAAKVSFLGYKSVPGTEIRVMCLQAIGKHIEANRDFKLAGAN